MTQPLTVKPVRADSSTCTQAGPRPALELNQLDVQNTLAFISPPAVQWAGCTAPAAGSQDLPEKVTNATSAKIENKLKQLTGIIIFLVFGSRVAPWLVGRRELGFLWTSPCLWSDSQVSTKGLAPSEPLPQLGTPSIPLLPGFSSVEEGLNAQVCLSFRWISLLWAAACFHRTAGACVLGPMPLCQIWSEPAKGLSSDGAGGVERGCGFTYKYRA